MQIPTPACVWGEFYPSWVLPDMAAPTHSLPCPSMSLCPSLHFSMSLFSSNVPSPPHVTPIFPLSTYPSFSSRQPMSPLPHPTSLLHTISPVPPGPTSTFPAVSPLPPSPLLPHVPPMFPFPPHAPSSPQHLFPSHPPAMFPFPPRPPLLPYDSRSSTPPFSPTSPPCPGPSIPSSPPSRPGRPSPGPVGHSPPAAAGPPRRWVRVAAGPERRVPGEERPPLLRRPLVAGGTRCSSIAGTNRGPGRGFESRRWPLSFQQTPQPQLCLQEKGKLRPASPRPDTDSLKEGAQGQTRACQQSVHQFNPPVLGHWDEGSPLPQNSACVRKTGQSTSESRGRKYPLHPTAGKRLPQNSSRGCQDESFIPTSFSQECGIVTPKQREAVGQQRAFGRTVTVPQLGPCLYLSFPRSQAAMNYEFWFFRLT